MCKRDKGNRDPISFSKPLEKVFSFFFLKPSHLKRLKTVLQKGVRTNLPSPGCDFLNIKTEILNFK